jgi:AcrR family transcriptional regulator
MDTTRPKPVAPRQLRAVETRRKLLAAVEEIVATEGPDAVTTTRLAQALGVAVGTIYRYFDDREALLLAAYDSTVERIVADCARVLERLPRDLSTAQAGGVLLAAYLSAAEAVPAHVGLLKAMRAIRPIEADQKGDAQQGILYDLFMPFLARYLPDVTSVAPAKLAFLTVMIGTMVDHYLMADPADRPVLRREIEAHIGLLATRIGVPER